MTCRSCVHLQQLNFWLEAQLAQSDAAVFILAANTNAPVQYPVDPGVVERASERHKERYRVRCTH